MAGKVVLFVVTTNGCGTSMIREICVAMGFKHLGTNPMRLWPIYVKAASEPNARCYPMLVGKEQNLTNGEALKNLYASWGYHPDYSDLYSETLAKRIFGEILSAKIPDENLLIVHDRTYIHEMSLDYDPSALTWSQGESDRAFGLLTDSLEEAPLDAKYLTVIRHPLSLYLSVLERGGRVLESRMSKISAFFHRVESVRADLRLNQCLLKYEDLCDDPDRWVRNIGDWAFPDSDAAHLELIWQKARKIPQRRPAGAEPQGEGSEDMPSLVELARIYDYEWIDQPRLSFWTKTKLDRYFYDVGLVVKLMSGTLNTSAALRHHKLTLPALMILRVMRRLPGLSHRWQRITDATTDNLGTGAEAPEDWLAV